MFADSREDYMSYVIINKKIYFLSTDLLDNRKHKISNTILNLEELEKLLSNLKNNVFN